MTLTNYLTANPDAVLEILNDIGCTDISYRKEKQEIRFSREEGRNPSSVCLYLSTLSFICFSTNQKGNLYTLVMRKKNIKFNEALEYIVGKLNIDKDKLDREIRFPFGGFYRKLYREISEPEYAMQTYDENILEPYEHKFNMMFFNDGINFQTQEKFKVGYDLETNAILIPQYTLEGKLCGVQARTNDSKCDHDKRWWAWLPCSRNLTLYGYHMNYQYIQEKGLCIIPEAEKSIMKLNQMGCKNAVALCGCIVSNTQAKYLKGMLVPRYIMTLDEGLTEEAIREQCKMIQVDNPVYQNQVGYVFDKEHKYLPEGSKLSPCDMSKEIFTQLIKECTIWL